MPKISSQQDDLQPHFICTSVSFSSCAASSLYSPLMTSCLLVSFLLRLDRLSEEANSLQLGGSCSNSRRRGSISSSCGEGLVGEWPGPSGNKTGPSELKNERSGRAINLDWLLWHNLSMTHDVIQVQSRGLSSDVTHTVAALVEVVDYGTTEAENSWLS